MGETAERVTEDAPRFVIEAAHRRYALVAGLCSGRTVLDLGCGIGELERYVSPWVEDYLGIDVSVVSSPPSVLNDDLMLYLQRGDKPYDTVVAIEVIEHLEPSLQREFIRLAYARANRRLILTTPSPDAHRWYPLSEHFFNADTNPYHLRCLHDWTVRRYVAETCVGIRDISVMPCWQEEKEELVWGVNSLAPTAHYLIIVDKKR